MYVRLRRDRNDTAAWVAVERWVGIWARAVLARHGPDVVQDAIADTCASVAITFDRARGQATFRGFVLGHWLNVRRRVLESNTGTVLTRLEGIDIPVDDVPDDEPDTEQLDWLRGAIEDLPDRQRRALVLRYFNGCSAFQIADALNVSPINARRLVFNGLSRLRAAAASSTALAGGRAWAYEAT